MGIVATLFFAVYFFSSRSRHTRSLRDWSSDVCSSDLGEGAAYLPAYAVGMIMLGGAAVLIATHQTRGTPGFLAVLIPLTLLEPALLSVFHQNLWQVVIVVDISMFLVASGLGVLFLIQQRAHLATPQAVVAVDAGPTPLAQVR